MLVAAKKLGRLKSPAPRIWKPEIGTGRSVSAEVSPRQHADALSRFLVAGDARIGNVVMLCMYA
jgi:hypothetical protein